MLIKALSVLTARYMIAVSVFYLIGIAACVKIRKRGMAAVILFVILTAVATYCFLLICPTFSYFGGIPSHVRTSRKLIALTFDDGPTDAYTPKILDALMRHKAKATFFVLGKNAARYPDVLKRIASEGHLLGNHTYSHTFLLTKSAGFRRDEITRTQDAVFALTGVRMKYFRAPYEYRDFRLVRLLQDMGLEYVSHDKSSLDGIGSPSEKIITQVLAHARPGDIVLMHDGGGNRTATIEAIEPILAGLDKMNFRMVTVEELLKAGNK